ncbi:hypothetical protein KBA41_15760 [Candidatus Ozemobacteraceae bacterium]|nr:hypothetical protein [Candidatus Ozemobacteraceae bacterium]
MSKRNRRGAPWLYLIMALLAAAFLYLFGWPIAKQVILHRGDEAFEEPARPAKPGAGAPAIPGDVLSDEP